MKENDYIDWSDLKKVTFTNETFRRKAETGTKLLEIYASKRRREKQHKWFLQLAASVFILLLSSVTAYNLADKTIEASLAEKKIILPDGSVALLKAASTLSYNRIQWFFNRKMHLNGSAKFNIESGRSCTVYTPDITVAVLGTIFEINQTGKITEVTCEQGHVRVFNNLVSKNLLGNETIRVNAAGYDFISAEDNFAKPVQIRELIYDSETLDKITTDLNIHYQCQIRLDSACKSDLFTGKVPEDNLDQALIIISECCGLKCRKKDGYIYLFK